MSRELRNALLRINSAMKSGASLSGAMTTIAEDVSFEMQMKVRDFSEKMNFFGVIFIIAAIVVPVLVALIGGITNAPIGIALLSPALLSVFYLVIMPLVLGYLIVYLVVKQPKV